MREAEFMRVASSEDCEAPFSMGAASSRRRKGTAWLLCRLTIAMFGIGYAWAVQYSRGASLFEDMGLSDAKVSLAFLAGPICGLIVQPVVGALSDQTTSRFGRRRPWIAAGLVLVVTSFLLIGDAYSLGGALGDSGSSRPRSLFIAVASFWVLDFSQNAVQLPCRTLVSDVLMASDVAAGNAMFSLFDGLGKLLSYSLGAYTLTVGARGDEPDFATDARAQFAIAAVVAFVSVGLTVVSVREEPATQAPERSGREAAVRAWIMTWKTMTQPARPVARTYELVAVKEDDDDDDNVRASSTVKAVAAEANAAYESWSERDCDPAKQNRGLFDDDDDVVVETTHRGHIPHGDERKEACSAVVDDDPTFFGERGPSRPFDSASPLEDGASSSPAGTVPSLDTLRRVCLVELGLWFGLSAWQVWGGILVGKDVCRGAPAADGVSAAAANRFQAGVNLFSLGNAAANLVSLLIAPWMPRLLRCFGARRLFLGAAAGLVVVMTALAALPYAFTHTAYLSRSDFPSAIALLQEGHARFVLTFILLALLGFPWAAHMNIPFSVVGRAYQDSPDVGAYMAILNTSFCVSQLAMTFVTPMLLVIFPDAISVCFLAGAAGGLFALYHASFLTIPYDETDADIQLTAAGH